MTASFRRVSSGQPKICQDSVRPDHAAVIVGNAWIGWWGEARITADFDRMAAAIEGMYAPHRVPVAGLMVFGQGALPLAPDMQGRALGIVTGMRPMLGRGAILLETRGLATALIASVAAAMLVVTRFQEVRTFRARAAALAWITDVAGVPEAALVDALELARATALQARASATQHAAR